MEKLRKYLPLISAILAIIAFAMLVVPVITNVGDNVFGTHTFNGFQTVFGTHEYLNGVSVHVLRYSFWNLLSYLLVVVTAVLGFMGFKKLNAKIGILSGACALIAGVIFFLVLNTTNFANQGVTGASMGIGAIIAGACAVLSAAAIITPSIMQIVQGKKALASEEEEAVEETAEETVEE